MSELDDILKTARERKDGSISLATLSKLIDSTKGNTSAGTILSKLVELGMKQVKTLEPGDVVAKRPIAAPVAYDLWYLWPHCNLMAKYYSNVVDGKETFDGDHADYMKEPNNYWNTNLLFLQQRITGLKPLKTIRDLKLHIDNPETYNPSAEPFEDKFPKVWANSGIYWINTAAFELWLKDIGLQYPSDGPKEINDYVGYISIPVGQLGTMEVISLIQEIKISGYVFTGGDSPSAVGYKYLPPLETLRAEDTPKTQTTILMFADMKDDNGNQLAGKNYCYGKHLVESAYIVPDQATASDLSRPDEKDEPPASRDVELHSSRMKDYEEDVRPKLWMRYWVHRESKLPVPGEFIGFLTRTQAVPPHVWWFQESNPFIYAGNWMETDYFTSGVITEITLEIDRPAGSVGDKFKVQIQGCEVTVYSTDFFRYTVGERVAIIKTKCLDTTGAEVDNLTKKTKSFTWLNQKHFKKTDEGTETSTYIIFPGTYFKANKAT